MVLKKSHYIVSFILLCVLLQDELFSSILSLTGTIAEEGTKTYEAIAIAGVSYILLLWDIVSGRILSKNWRVFFVMFILLALYYLTGIFYTTPASGHKQNLLTFGALCIPACYMGMRLARNDLWREIEELLPYFCIVLTTVLGTIGFGSASIGELLRENESGLSYQSLSYYLSFLYSYSAYYVFINSGKHAKKYKMLKWPMLLTMAFSAIVCLMSGGRGAFVFIVIVTVYVLWRTFESSKMNKSLIFIVFFILGVCFFALYSYFDVSRSAGMLRVTGNLTDDSIREEIWVSAINYFKQSPLFGWGLGSIWWTVGYYSHNIFTDLLAETGLFGTLIVSWCIVNMYTRLLKYIKKDIDFEFVFIVLLAVSVQLLFSAYWFGSYKLFFVFGLVYSLPKYGVKHCNRNVR